MRIQGKKRIVTILLAAVVLISIAGCQTTKESSLPTELKKDKKVKIGFSMATLQEERWQRDRDIFVAKAKEMGGDVIVQTANNNSDDQIDQVKFLLEQDIDILLIVPHDAEKASAAVQLAKKSGIKVIAYDRLVKNANVDLYLSFDNVKVGEMMAEYIYRKVPTGNYIIINGAKTDHNSYMFNQGYKKVLKPYIDKGFISVINEIWTEDWRPEDAFNCVEKTLQKGININAIIAANDSLAGAAIEALAEQRLAGKVEVAGHDADISGCQRVAEGTQLMTIYKPIEIIAEKAAEISIRMAKGKDFHANSEINDGKYNVPYEMIEPVLITKSNLEETVIKGSFHRLEDVYRNVPKTQWPKNSLSQ
ncbi:MAG: substrate-binding domain-containing protein [Clostridia bacterium]|nr:substrate-binding domain-containing protein [Clostridia bacterium]